VYVKRVKRNRIAIYLKYRKVLRWLGEDPIPWSVFFFFFFFFYNALIFYKVQKASCRASYRENKTYKSKEITKESHGTG